MFLSSTQNGATKSTSRGAGAFVLRCFRSVKFHLSDTISPVRAFLVVFYALLVVGGLLQTDFSPNGKLTSPHSHDSGLAEVVEFEGESKSEIQLPTLTPNWTMPTFEVTATLVVNDRPQVTSVQQQTVSQLRGPPVV